MKKRVKGEKEGRRNQRKKTGPLALSVSLSLSPWKHFFSIYDSFCEWGKHHPSRLRSESGVPTIGLDPFLEPPSFLRSDLVLWPLSLSPKCQWPDKCMNFSHSLTWDIHPTTVSFNPSPASDWKGWSILFWDFSLIRTFTFHILPPFLPSFRHSQTMSLSRLT